CMFLMIYRFLPNAEPGCRGRTALVSAIVATFVLELAKYGFTKYLPDAARYGAVYGGVASVVLMMMWLYISSSIILLGAEVAAAYAEVQALAKGTPKPTLHKPGDSEAALGHGADELVKHG
ncbi:MAG: rane protein, partial [Abditibacteriota bacterium]|nr:rane protein [Abditibacteriota bacterium]